MTKEKTATDTPAMDSWTMATSILVGVRQAIAKATEEHAAIRAANPDRMFIAEASTVAATIETLIDVERTLDWELGNNARSSGLPMPERVG